MALDADLAYSRGRFTDFDPVGDHIPGAIEGVVSAGVSHPAESRSARLTAAWKF